VDLGSVPFNPKPPPIAGGTVDIGGPVPPKKGK
jgi:hypothetical protein